MLRCLKERCQNEGHLAVTTTNIQVQIELKYIKNCLHSIFRDIHIFPLWLVQFTLPRKCGNFQFKSTELLICLEGDTYNLVAKMWNQTNAFLVFHRADVQNLI